MEKAMIKALLEKYFQAETSIEEEAALAAWFREADDSDPELAAYKDLFSYFEQEAQVTAGPDLGRRILERVGMADGATQSIGISDASPVIGMNVPPRRSFRIGLAAAAAVIAVLTTGLFLLTPPQRSPVPKVASVTIQDTYDDPQQALAAVRHALLVASAHLNEGRRPFTGPKQ
ncbi:MAG TPA: hypothetical protein VNU70_10700 [Puia sp.]|jgi:hypothetical protein|nr:hypothetical protein [Puia sp.]